MSLGREIKKRRPFEVLEEEAMLNVVRTADVLQRELTDLFRPFDLSQTQYNVLRILRGALDEAEGGLACGEIAARMITRDPDVTRLLDRLEKRALISRSRDEKDRRIVFARITSAGKKLLAELDPRVAEAHKERLGHMSREDLRQLIALLEAARRNAPMTSDQ